MTPITEFQSKYRWLSNFWMLPSPIPYEGHLYPTVEHAYQAAKTLDEGQRMHIRTLVSPGQAKKEGRRLTIRPDWNDVKINIMEELVFAKFMSDCDLAEKLMETDPRELIEGNTWGDTFWGQCNGKGDNYLGKILMEVRDYLLGLSDQQRLGRPRGY